jgi:hypothetical protein
MQVLHPDVGHGDVILWVVGDLPNVMGAGRIEYECPVEIPTYSAWCGFDQAAFPDHLGIVSITSL